MNGLFEPYNIIFDNQRDQKKEKTIEFLDTKVKSTEEDNPPSPP
jgi:hypothetical protein